MFVGDDTHGNSSGRDPERKAPYISMKPNRLSNFAQAEYYERDDEGPRGPTFGRVSMGMRREMVKKVKRMRMRQGKLVTRARRIMRPRKLVKGMKYERFECRKRSTLLVGDGGNFGPILVQRIVRTRPPPPFCMAWPFG